MHGIALTIQRKRLAKEGFAPSTFSYPSVRLDLDKNSRLLSDHLSRIPGGAVNIVAHSLGGLVVLNMLAQQSAPHVRRVVLMGSPCGGSHCASVLLQIPLLAMIVGRSIRDCAARNHWEIPTGVEIGVIAGTRSLGLGRVIPGLPRPNDGVVSVEETRLAGCRDAIALPVSHSEMLFSRACAAQFTSFLRKGRFIHA